MEFKGTRRQWLKEGRIASMCVGLTDIEREEGQSSDEPREQEGETARK